MIATQMNEAPLAATRRGSKGNTTENRNCGMPRAESKAFATLQAEFALLGYTICRVTPCDRPGWFMAARWGRTRDLHSLDEVRSFLRQIGGTA